MDTGPLVAFVDASDQYHNAAVSLLGTYRGPFYVPMLVVAEVTHMLRRRVGTYAEIQFLADLVDGHFAVEAVEPIDWRRITELATKYRDLPLGTVDASIIVAAERLNIPTIATFDRRHFTVVRPAHIEAFDLVP